MAVESSGILMYRFHNKTVEVFLVHPGGPFFANKDLGAWSIPKGLPEDGEDFQKAAKREFKEETGVQVKNSLLPLGSIRQKGGKVVHAWATAGDLPVGYEVRSNYFDLEWPPRSGRHQQFPEIDKGGFFSLEAARKLINPAQQEFLERLANKIGTDERRQAS